MTSISCCFALLTQHDCAFLFDVIIQGGKQYMYYYARRNKNKSHYNIELELLYSYTEM